MTRSIMNIKPNDTQEQLDADVKEAFAFWQMETVMGNFLKRQAMITARKCTEVMEEEISALQIENNRLKAERDSLKNALAAEMDKSAGDAAEARIEKLLAQRDDAREKLNEAIEYARRVTRMKEVAE